MPDIGPTLAGDARRAEIDAAVGEALHAARDKSYWPDMRICRRSRTADFLQQEAAPGVSHRIVAETKGDFKGGRGGTIPFTLHVHLELSHEHEMWMPIHVELKVFNTILFFKLISNPGDRIVLERQEDRDASWLPLFTE